MQAEWIRRPEAETSVVFVHGVLSSGEDCWRHETGSYWPELLKSEPELGSLGIYVFTYQTEIFSGSYRLSDIVDALKEHMRLDGVLGNDRLIFVCHSMGGIVVRKYILERAIELIETEKEIGLFLVSSPSLGSSYADWLSPLAQLFGHAQADALRFVRDNDWLKDLDKEFNNLKEAGKLRIKGKELVEDKFVFLKKLWRRQVVEPFSGARYFPEPFKVPESDHFSIAKPKNKGAIQHRLLCQFIQDTLESSTPFKKRTTAETGTPLPPQPISLPPPPRLFIGREESLRDLKQRLGIASPGQTALPMQALTIVRGLPGVGKTAISIALAHDAEVERSFHEGILWGAIGEKPNLLAEIASWGSMLRSDALLQASTLKEATDLLAVALRKRCLLLIVDDLWQTEDAVPFLRARGNNCALVITTRLRDVANEVAAQTPDAIYELPRLTEDNAFKLLHALAPAVVREYPNESRELIRDLEGLPLALQVAGRLLNCEHGKGWGVPELLSDLRQGKQLLDAKAPLDRIDLETQTIPTVEVLLRKSTDRLEDYTRDCFAKLGVFAPKPATFDENAMKEIWEVENPKPIADELINRGLLDPAGSRRFQMHALLVMHARSFFPPEYAIPE